MDGGYHQEEHPRAGRLDGAERKALHESDDGRRTQIEEHPTSEMDIRRDRKKS